MSTMRSAGFVLRLLAGAALFTVAQAAMSSMPPFGPPTPGAAPNWFLNSIQGVAIVGLIFLAAGVLSALAGAGDSSSAALPLTIGGAAAVAVMLAWIGGGNLFPIVVIVGADASASPRLPEHRRACRCGAHRHGSGSDAARAAMETGVEARTFQDSERNALRCSAITKPMLDMTTAWRVMCEQVVRKSPTADLTFVERYVQQRTH